MDFLDKLRQKLGIHVSAKDAGEDAPEESAWERKQRLYREHMQKLSQGGSDSDGRERWQRLMKRLGRAR